MYPDVARSMQRLLGLAGVGAGSVHVGMKHEAPASHDLRPGSRVYHGSREAAVLSVDADPTAHVWIVYADNPDEDAIVHREELAMPCSICEKAGGPSTRSTATCRRASARAASTTEMVRLVHRSPRGRNWPTESDGTDTLPLMPLLLVVLLLLLLLGGGGFYWGGPAYGGGGLGLVLVICLIIYLMGGFGRKP